MLGLAHAMLRCHAACHEPDEYHDIRLSVGDAEAICNRVRDGDLTLANEQRKRLREGRAHLLNEMNKHVPEGLRVRYQELMAESRNSEAEIGRIVRSAMEDVHAERMVAIAAASNAIADKSAKQAKALKFATWALVVVTGVLIAATIAGAFIARSS